MQGADAHTHDPLSVDQLPILVARFDRNSSRHDTRMEPPCHAPAALDHDAAALADDSDEDASMPLAGLEQAAWSAWKHQRGKQHGLGMALLKQYLQSR